MAVLLLAGGLWAASPAWPAVATPGGGGALASATASSVVPVSTQSPAPPIPTLVLDAGQHTAPVRRLAVSPDGRLLATASDDKTVALWRTDTGERLHVLRALPGPGAEGRMYGAAFHPREPLLAVGGTGPAQAGALIQWHASDSGELRRVAAAGLGEIKRLAYSADGRWLLAAFAAPGALRVYAGDGRLVAEHPLAGDGYGLDVHASGRVAVTDTAGAVHLFVLNEQGQLAQAQRVALGGTPVAAAFAPSSSAAALRAGPEAPLRLAVVHFDADRQGAVTLLDASPGATAAPLVWKATALGRGRLQAVAWSRDATRLAIGGVHNATGATGRAAIDALRGFVQEFDARTGAPGALHDVATDAVTDLRAAEVAGDASTAATATWAYAAFDGRIGLTGRQLALAPPQRGTVRRPDRLWVAPGSVVQWQDSASETPWHFSLPERVLRAGPAPQARAAEEPGLIGPSARDWDSVVGAVPVIQGARMPMDTGEISRAVARLPGTDDVAWGTGHRLVRVAPGGRVVWTVRPGTETRAVHGGAEGAHVVAALSDGTLRWYRARDGELLLSFFALGPRQWVLWSPGGYYDASAGAEPLLGWLLPRGPGAAGDASTPGAAGPGLAEERAPLYLSIGRFRERFHRPDVIDRVLVDGDEKLALERADQARAPMLRADALPAAPAPVTSPATASTPAPLSVPVPAALPVPSLPSTLPPVLVHKQSPAVLTAGAEVTLSFAMRADAQRPVTALVVRRDGVLQEDARIDWPPAAEPGAPVRVTVAVPPGESVVHVAATNANGTSDALAFKVLRTPLPLAAAAQPALPAVPALPAAPAGSAAPAVPATPAAPADERPRLFALLVGVGRYADPQISGLDLPGKDAEDMARVLAAQAGRAYREAQTRVLTDERATRAAIVAGLEWLARSVGPRDFGVLFLAGHALNHGHGQYHFLGHDVAVDRLAATAVPQSQIRATLARLRGRAVLFVDTCHAGDVFGSGRAGSGAGGGAGTSPGRSSGEASRDLARLANDLASPENGVIVFASSTGRQLSLESRAWGNGAFTRALVAGLNGGADFMGRGKVTFQGLGYYVSAEVEKLTGGRQTPVVIAPPPGLPDFTLAVLQRERLGAAWPAPQGAGRAATPGPFAGMAPLWAQALGAAPARLASPHPGSPLP